MFMFTGLHFSVRESDTGNHSFIPLLKGPKEFAVLNSSGRLFHTKAPPKLRSTLGNQFLA